MLWKSCCGVFEGGGVRGNGHVGAAYAMQEAGYQFTDLAGSSAGAIAAALLAAGYSCDELKKEMESLDYMKFKGKGLASHFGLPGKAFSIVFRLGIYNTVWLEGWVGEMLKEKGIYTFGDLWKKGRILKITASDLTDRRLLILPDDLKDFGLDPDLFSIARAVRMSVGIPVFFSAGPAAGQRWKRASDCGRRAFKQLSALDSGSPGRCGHLSGFWIPFH